MREILLMVLAVSVADVSLAQDVQPSPSHLPAREITQPDWKRVPSPPDFFSVYPVRARRLNVTGTASMRCRVTLKGRVKDCQSLSEDPPGFGFAKAELSLAKYFELPPMTVDGKPVESEITVPMRFDLK